MKLRKSRGVSFVIIILIYIMAGLLGFAVYRMLPYVFWLNMLIADAAATVVVYIFSVILGNASVYDPYWSVQPFVIMLGCMADTTLTASRILTFLVVCFWSVRLTANWAYTFHGLTHQDWRYTGLQEKTGHAYQLVNFLGIHMIPTLVVFACVQPVVYIFKYDGQMNLKSCLFLLVSLLAVILQGISDVQMHHFRAEKHMGFIHDGAWKYSRHPNYLGEILMWWGIALAAVSLMPERKFLLLGAFLNTCLFLFISIPLADGHQARKAGFEEYKHSTRMLLPIPRLGQVEVQDEGER